MTPRLTCKKKKKKKQENMGPLKLTKGCILNDGNDDLFTGTSQGCMPCFAKNNKCQLLKFFRHVSDN